MIGEGGQAKIYIAKTKTDGKAKYWAVKEFNKLRMELNIKRFTDMKKEITCLRELNKSMHLSGINNIIHLEESIVTEHSYYLIFDYCNGGDLREMLISTFPMKKEVIQHIIKSIAYGLQAMH